MKKFSQPKDVCSTIEEATARVKTLTMKIAEDRIITDEEVDTLLQWLNHNSQYKSHWPFKELYKFLFDAFEDGQISEEERTALLALIDEIQRVTP